MWSSHRVKINSADMTQSNCAQQMLVCAVGLNGLESLLVVYVHQFFTHAKPEAEQHCFWCPSMLKAIRLCPFTHWTPCHPALATHPTPTFFSSCRWCCTCCVLTFLLWEILHHLFTVWKKNSNTRYLGGGCV